VSIQWLHETGGRLPNSLPHFGLQHRTSTWKSGNRQSAAEKKRQTRPGPPWYSLFPALMPKIYHNSELETQPDATQAARQSQQTNPFPRPVVGVRRRFLVCWRPTGGDK
jgi:hypothetical protein